MRKIGSLESIQKADTFRLYLISQNIDTQLNETEEKSPDIWIFHDRDLKKAKSLFEEFQKAVDLSSFQEAAEKVRRSIAAASEKKKQQVRRRVKTETYFQATYFLMVVSVLFYALHFVDKGHWLQSQLMISLDFFGGHFQKFSEISRGQVWRLFTPIFIHTDFFHIAFNLLWLYQLGRVVEEPMGAWRFIALTLFIAIPSNVAFYLVSGPVFGGMSGVIYGLYFYIWGHERFARHSPYRSDPYLFKFFIIYYVLCWILTALGMRVANTIHGVGAFCGFLAAYFSSGAWKSLSRPRRFHMSNVYNTLIVLSLLVGGVLADVLTK